MNTFITFHKTILTFTNVFTAKPFLPVTTKVNFPSSIKILFPFFNFFKILG